jgi:hypothetical protein
MILPGGLDDHGLRGQPERQHLHKQAADLRKHLMIMVW